MASCNFRAYASVAEGVAGVGRTNDFSGFIEDSHSVSTLDAVYQETIALAAGTATINLTALTRTGRTALDLTGMTVLGYAIKNNGANSMAFVKAATNGYDMFNTTPGHDVAAGGFLYQRDPAGYGVVGTTARDITVTGTGTQTFSIVLFADTV